MQKRLFKKFFEECSDVVEEFSYAQMFNFLLERYIYDSRIFILEYLRVKA